MNPGRRLVGLALAASLLALPAAAAPGAVTAQEESAGPISPDACVAGWRSLPLPETALRSRPYEIVTQDGQPSVIVGGFDGGPLILRRTADGWEHLDTSSARLDDDAPVALLDAALSPDGTLWAAGYVRPQRGVLEPYTGELDGTRWKERRVKGLPDARIAVAGVATKGADRAWAVGTKLDTGRTQAYAMRWDGSAWRDTKLDLGKRESALTAVTSTPKGEIWAVGWATAKSGHKRPLIAKVKADGLSRMDGPRLPDGTAVLTDVEFTRGADGWATGYHIATGSSQHRPFVAHWDGQAWTATLVPWEEPGSAIPRSLSVSGDGAIWLAGTLLTPDSPEPQGFVLRAADGPDGTWRLDDDLPLAAGRSEIYSVAVTDEGAMISGIDSGGGHAVLLETCDEAAADEAGRAGASGQAAGTSRATTHAQVAGERRLPPPLKPEGFRLEDVSEEAGLGMEMHTLAGLVADLDADGWEDLFVWSHGDDHLVMRGGPDGFVPGREEAFGGLDRHQCSVADVDGDDRLDVFCTSGRARGSAIDRNELSLAPGYEDGGVVPDLLGIEDPFGRGRAATFIQLDDDGAPDLFVTSSPDRGDALPGTNRFFRNVDGRFVSAPEVGLDRSTGGWCAEAADIDADGDEDLLLCQEHSDDARDPGLRVFVNEDGALVERSRKLGLEPIDDVAALASDLNGDGRADIVQLSRTRLRVSKGTGKGTFKPVYEVLTPRALDLAIGDVNGDDRPDIYVVAGSSRGNETDLLLVNDGSGRSFTSVRVPQGETGSGAYVLAVDHDHNGLSDFIVLDGHGAAMGPVRLLASFPAS